MTGVLRSLPIVLAISAMLLRALLPMGWMPSGDAHAPLIVCPMMGGMHAVPGKPSPPTHRNRFCPFTAALAQLSAPAAPPLFSLPRQNAASRPTMRIVAAAYARPYRPQASRAPPVAA